MIQTDHNYCNVTYCHHAFWKIRAVDSKEEILNKYCFK